MFHVTKGVFNVDLISFLRSFYDLVTNFNDVDILFHNTFLYQSQNNVLKRVVSKLSEHALWSKTYIFSASN